jgi:hypothetical protein
LFITRVTYMMHNVSNLDLLHSSYYQSDRRPSTNPSTAKRAKDTPGSLITDNKNTLWTAKETGEEK